MSGAPTNTKQLFLRVKKRDRSQLAQRNADDGEIAFASDEERVTKKSRLDQGADEEDADPSDVIVLNCPDVGGSEGSRLLFRRFDTKAPATATDAKDADGGSEAKPEVKKVAPVIKRTVVASLAERSSKTAATADGSTTTQARNARALVKQRAKLRCDRITKSRKGLIIHAQEGEDLDADDEGGDDGGYVMYVADIPTQFDSSAAAFGGVPTTSLDDIDLFERHLAMGSVDDQEDASAADLLDQIQWASKYAPYELVGVPGVESWVALHNSITHAADFEADEGDSEDFDLGNFVLDHSTAVADEYRALAQRKEEIARGAEDDYDSNSSANASDHEFNGIDDDEQLGQGRRRKANRSVGFEDHDDINFGEGDGLDSEDDDYLYDDDSDDDLEDGWHVGGTSEQKKRRKKMGEMAHKFGGGGVGFSSSDEGEGMFDSDDYEDNVELDDALMRNQQRSHRHFDAMSGADRGADLQNARSHRQHQWSEAQQWGQPKTNHVDGHEEDDMPMGHQDQLEFPSYEGQATHGGFSQYAEGNVEEDDIRRFCA